MMMSADLLVAWLVASFASYRIARLITVDTLFLGTRTKVQVWLANRKGLWAEKADDLLGCPYCVGAWVSLAVWLAVARYGVPSTWSAPIVMHAVMWLAVAGGQATLQHLDSAAH